MWREFGTNRGSCVLICVELETVSQLSAAEAKKGGPVDRLSECCDRLLIQQTSDGSLFFPRYAQIYHDANASSKVSHDERDRDGSL